MFTRPLYVLSAFALAATSVACASESKARHVDAKAAAELLKSNPEIVVLDVRTPAEFGAGHLAKAKNLDAMSATFAKDVKALDASKTYLVHCASGGRSTRALPTLEGAGLKKLVHLDGGFLGWKAAGLPVTQK